MWVLLVAVPLVPPTTFEKEVMVAGSIVPKVAVLFENAIAPTQISVA